MAKSSVPIPSLKKPSLSVDAMAAFVAGTDTPPAEHDSPSAPAESPTLSLAPAAPVPGADPAEAKEAADAQAGAAPTARSRAPKKGTRRLEGRKDGSLTRKVTLYLAPDLDKQLSLYAITNDVDRSEVVAELLAKFLRKNT